MLKTLTIIKQYNRIKRRLTNAKTMQNADKGKKYIKGRFPFSPVIPGYLASRRQAW